MKRKGLRNPDWDYEIKFWKDWLYADPLKRRKLVSKLPLFDTTIKIKDEKFARDVFSSQLGSYFEDLESAIYTKTRLEDAKRKKDRKKF